MALDSKQSCLLVLLVVSVLSILAALVLSVVNVSDLSLPPRTKFGMVFDAGSSHTSLFVYQWPADKENNTGVVSQAHVCDVEGPGISSYANNPPAAGKSLINCLEEALAIIPPESQKETPAYLGATAGMRLLRLENEAASDKVLAEVSKTIGSYPVDFRGARIISGEEEGSYGWITINYLLESFMKCSFTGRWLRPFNAKIYGALDLGGASTQISFIPKVPIEDPKEQAEFNLYGFPYTIYTHSYLCYGQNQALRQMLVKAAAGKDLKKPVNVPCYPKGFRETLPLESLYSSPCTTAAAPSPPPVQVILLGTGDAAQCRTLMKTILDFSACGRRTSCAFDGVYQPPIAGNYYAFSAFFYTFDFLNLTSGQPLDEVLTTIHNFCATEWSELQSSYPKEKSERLRDYCANSNYILTLLLDAYKFNTETWNSITFLKQAANTDIGWTLGYMLNLTNMIPSESGATMKAHNHDIWVAAIFFIVLSLVFGLFVLFTYFR
ncbi:ectonucleoside triphosphate diphosphohydrolase 8-like [Discoglossus pictus]